MRMSIGGALLCQRTHLSGSDSGSTRRLAHPQFKAHSHQLPASINPPVRLRMTYRAARRRSSMNPLEVRSYAGKTALRRA